ncbi:hypothetical protein TcasGA2_TC009658 [Tribolium castaneum]|uniref:CHK kinase-like domain-containing protein n=1 Tax=Tribolium castaneum TaxID=7070 RepID=D6WTH5_TRICA|nr:PREDICTED: uncharacterized protein LOC663183 [Tribolium castaneum]EFA06727.1 hypothetical protein TcasGA2_TC009658 [Tribolium castaneum]|eukprot:XP_015837022.1 PREDICTED: uncharacterized protein LOC663183 [Tribolium castaneum]
MPNVALESEIKTWLAPALKKENVADFSVKILGNSEKGDGYVSDVVFVEATTSGKQFNLVLKCSKRSKALREKMPMRRVFLHEIFMYEKLQPTFLQLQKDHNCEKPFVSYPKCHGSFVGDDVEVIILENLKKRGFELWPKKQPLARKLVDLVVTEYGKYHALSVAMREKHPEKFHELVETVIKGKADFGDMETMVKMFQAPIEDSHNLLKGEVDDKILDKWRNFQNDVHFIMEQLDEGFEGLKVILHGDCWNNNFMFLLEDGDHNRPLKVAILDWQIARYTTPIFDLSYFLFSCVSGRDFEELDDILATYFDSFTGHLKSLGISEPELLYSKNEFLKDWTRFCKYGILMSTFLMKVVSTDKDEVVDIAENAEKGKNIEDVFLNEIRDKDNFKNRTKVIIQYAIKNNLI